MDQNGYIYGSTRGGGGGGTVFRMNPPSAPGGAWTETVLYVFAGGSDGDWPAGLSLGPGGEIYGTTHEGGGAGTVFELMPPSTTNGAWTHLVLHRFQSTLGGEHPGGNVLLGANGVLYGTTIAGGNPSTHNSCGGRKETCGVVFELTPPVTPGGPWKETVIHAFTGLNGDGARPQGDLAMDDNGALYGTTELGGLGDGGGGGTVFQVRP